MDNLTLLRRMRDDVERPTDAYLAKGREKLLAQIHTSTGTVEPGQVSMVKPSAHQPPHFSKHLLRSVIGAAAAALLTAALVVTDVVDVPGRSPLNAEAVAVLENAATASIHTSDPILTSGHYLKIETRTVHATSSTTMDGAEATWEKTRSMQYYIPANPNDEWVANQDPDVVSESAPEAVKELVRLFPIEDPEMFDRVYGVTRSPGGIEFMDDLAVFGTPATSLEELPRDPHALLERIYDQAGSEGTADGSAFESIIWALRTGLLPADLRAAIYEATALIPGVDITDKQATLDGREGIALGRLSADENLRHEIVIDPATGLLIGERSIVVEGIPDFPAGTVLAWTSVRTSVVTSAP